MGRGNKIHWTPEMLSTLKEKYPTTFNKVLALELGVSWRTLVRKARELGIEKEDGFLDKNRSIISEMAQASRPENPTKGMKGWCVPNSEAHRFKKGNVPPNKNNPNLVEQSTRKRNETIRKERMRIRYGLPQQSNLKLKPYEAPKTKYN